MPKTKENKIQTKDVTEPQRILWKVTSGQNKAIPVLSSATWWIRWAFLVCSLYCNKKKSENEEMIVDAIVKRKRVPVLLHIESLIDQAWLIRMKTFWILQVSRMSGTHCQNSSDFFRKCGYENHAHAFDLGKGSRFILVIVGAFTHLQGHFSNWKS